MVTKERKTAAAGRRPRRAREGARHTALAVKTR
jgi:hypothetical protein